jgi:RNA polymerase sigma factor (TIGR02999 family)
MGCHGYRHSAKEFEPKGDLTRLLHAWSNGDAHALKELTPRVYAELKGIARRRMASERIGHTQQPSALVNEAYIRLVDGKNVDWKDRGHFFAVAAQIMRRVLVDHARTVGSDKRGGDARRVTLTTTVLGVQRKTIDFVAMDEALERLAQFDSRKVQVVELRVFGCLEVEEAAKIIGVSEVTARRDWKLALAWLRRELES